MNYRVPADTVRLDLQPSMVLGRRVDLDIVFRNLIDNAVKYAGATPQVEVSLRPSADGQVVVRIADNGRGIPHHLRRKIFGRFVRLGLELEREKPGTGSGTVHRPHARAAVSRPYPRARSRKRAGQRVRGATARQRNCKLKMQIDQSQVVSSEIVQLRICRADNLNTVNHVQQRAHPGRRRRRPPGHGDQVQPRGRRLSRDHRRRRSRRPCGSCRKAPTASIW